MYKRTNSEKNTHISVNFGVCVILIKQKLIFRTDIRHIMSCHYELCHTFHI